MNVYNWLCLFGVPGILTGITGYLISLVRTQRKRQQSLELGMQALLRDRLIQSYKVYEKQGYAEIDDRENWHNMWDQYHNLGANGVLDSLKEKMLAMPTGPSK